MDVHGGWWGGGRAIFDALPVFESECRCVCSVLLGHLFLLNYGTEVNVCAFLCVCLTVPGAEASACALLCVSDHSWC